MIYRCGRGRLGAIVNRAFSFVIAGGLAMYVVPGLAQGKPPVSAEQQAREQWRASLMTQPAGSECREATYPETTWREVPCATTGAKEVPYASPHRVLHPLDEHASFDITAKTSGSLSSATGSLYELSNLGSLQGQPANYSVQLNTNGFQPTPLCKGSTNGGCLGWEQFVLDSNGTFFIQTWLGNYLDAKTTKCPANWNNFKGISCWRNAVSQNWAAVPVSGLAGVSITGQTASNGQDTMSVTVGGKTYETPATNTQLALSGHWNDVDFNVFGEKNGLEATFNVGTLAAVNVSLNDGTGNAPTCSSPFSGGFGTLETTNLTLGPCGSIKQIGPIRPSIFFYESVPPLLKSVQANSGSSRGGDAVTITGSGFSNNVAVKFGNTYVGGAISCSQATSCRMTTPPGSGTVPVTAVNLTAAGGEGAFSTTAGAPQFTYKQVPVGSIQPSSGTPGTTVTMTGSSFSTAPGATKVVFTVRGSPLAATNVNCPSATRCTMSAPVFADLGNVAVPSTVDVVVNGEASSVGAFFFVVPTVHLPPVSCAQCRANGQACKTVGGSNICVGTIQ